MSEPLSTKETVKIHYKSADNRPVRFKPLPSIRGEKACKSVWEVPFVPADGREKRFLPQQHREWLRTGIILFVPRGQTLMGSYRFSEGRQYLYINGLSIHGPAETELLIPFVNENSMTVSMAPGNMFGALTLASGADFDMVLAPSP